jgi:hypothetical protein
MLRRTYKRGGWSPLNLFKSDKIGFAPTTVKNNRRVKSKKPNSVKSQQAKQQINLQKVNQQQQINLQEVNQQQQANLQEVNQQQQANLQEVNQQQTNPQQAKQPVNLHEVVNSQEVNPNPVNPKQKLSSQTGTRRLNIYGSFIPNNQVYNIGIVEESIQINPNPPVRATKVLKKGHEKDVVIKINRRNGNKKQVKSEQLTSSVKAQPINKLNPLHIKNLPALGGTRRKRKTYKSRK